MIPSFEQETKNFQKLKLVNYNHIKLNNYLTKIIDESKVKHV